MEQLTAYIGRDNEERLGLLQDGSSVVASSVTRAIMRAEAFCLDTDEDPTLLYFDSDNTVLCIKAGLIPDIAAGEKHTCLITLYDALTTNGYAWDNVKIKVRAWPICET